jgi:hypothetical protein
MHIPIQRFPMALFFTSWPVFFLLADSGPNCPQLFNFRNSTGSVRVEVNSANHKNTTPLIKLTLISAMGFVEIPNSITQVSTSVLCFKNPLQLVIEPVMFVNLNICGRFWGQVGEFGRNRLEDRTLLSRVMFNLIDPLFIIKSHSS